METCSPFRWPLQLSRRRLYLPPKCLKPKQQRLLLPSFKSCDWKTTQGYQQSVRANSCPLRRGLGFGTLMVQRGVWCSASELCPLSLGQGTKARALSRRMLSGVVTTEPPGLEHRFSPWFSMRTKGCLLQLIGFIFSEDFPPEMEACIAGPSLAWEGPFPGRVGDGC